MEVLRGRRSANGRPINSNENSDALPESYKRNERKTVLKVGQWFGRRCRIIQARSPSSCSDVFLYYHDMNSFKIGISSLSRYQGAILSYFPA